MNNRWPRTLTPPMPGRRGRGSWRRTKVSGK
jgi:hypothetical protein